MVRAHEWDAHRRLGRASGTSRPWWTPVCPAPDRSVGLDRWSTGQRAVVLVRGELDTAAAARLEAYVTGTPLSGRSVLELDLAGVPWTGSAGLSAFVALRRWCDARGATLVLRSVQPSVWRVFQLAGLDGVFDTEPGTARPAPDQDLLLF
ncbi:STAS domain-containing protein [Goekera deserti]|uniref:STAS domain-containing protein n=1 Tax=Goekera deserti TaxID=2497753 RepID=A0A7K3WBI8_9ACTN|nr:STAS domain-containing protein [Goekera deserti]NDI49637.1 STAS domain-containing protein [Goekera deserti]NEL53170.1 STAS domain-containing protein [Goekera deserti]